jgi:hypothetical protein
LIPGEFYKGGTSLSPRPVKGEGEEKRKATVRRWMVACKVSEYVIPFFEVDSGLNAFGMVEAAWNIGIKTWCLATITDKK